MKSLITLFIFSFLLKLAFPQEYSFPLFFEDAAGNKDTLYFGFDQSATSGIDVLLGEVNIFEQIHDSIFFTFFTDAVLKEDENCNLNSEKNPSYISKSQFIKQGLDFVFEAGFIVNQWPVNISWDTVKIETFEKNYPENNMHLIITSWHPPGGWFDALCCRGNWPENFILLSEKSSIQLNKQSFCRYKMANYRDSVNLFFIGFIWHTASDIKKMDQKEISVNYDKNSKSVRILNTDKYPQVKIEIFDIWGQKVFENEINNQTKQQVSVKISVLRNGLHILRLSDLKTHSILSNHKIIIQ